MLLVVARVEGEGDDVGDRVDGEAREDDSGARRREAHSMCAFIGCPAASRANLAQVRVVGVRRYRSAVRYSKELSKVHAKDCDDCGDGKAARLDRVERKIAVTGDLSPAERKRLLEIAEMCPVHRTLESGSTVVVSSLVDA